MWIKTQTQNINNTNDPQKKYRLETVSKIILLEGLNRFHGANLTLSSDEDQNTKHKQHKWSTEEVPPWNGQYKFYWRA